MQKGNQLSVNISINENNGEITHQCRQRLSLCHIGFVNDHGGHLVNQPIYYVLKIVEKQHLKMK